LIGKGARVKIMPMVHMLCSSAHEPVGCLAITDYTGYLEDNGKKDATYIAEKFKPNMDELYPNIILFDCIFFTGLQISKRPEGSCK
jgi:hypothetical protein